MLAGGDSRRGRSLWDDKSPRARARRHLDRLGSDEPDSRRAHVQLRPSALAPSPTTTAAGDFRRDSSWGCRSPRPRARHHRDRRGSDETGCRAHAELRHWAPAQTASGRNHRRWTHL
mmetsp:Transcript_127503/g.366787  ORF Transcript_127503/g.366787 Transcript_127503/m.366787 type:complete len:117 (+) Transcript_127503:707-1057(+)